MLNWRPVLEIERRTRQIEHEIEQLRIENAKLAKLNARDEALDASIKALCFPTESTSTQAPPTEPD
jgi:uncharacterized protein YdcH (DUF465 family)